VVHQKWGRSSAASGLTLMLFSFLACWLVSQTLSSALGTVPGAPLDGTDPVGIQDYALDDAHGGNGDGWADPGETISLTVTLANRGEEPVDHVQATIDTASPYVTFTHATLVAYGDFAGGEIRSAQTPFSFLIDEGMPRGRDISFTLTISATGSGPWSDALAVPVGWWRTHLPLVWRDYFQERIPNDEHYPLSWALPLIEAPQAWALSTGDPAVIIAIVDTGVDLDHPDLEGKLWVNVGEIPDNGVDDDGNGFVDDVHGYDFWYDDPVPDDDNGHGTQVAGVAAAATDNVIGVASLGWSSTLMPLKTQGSNGWGTTNELVEAIIYAVDNGAKVINMSVGQELTLCPDVLQEAIDYADSHGVLVVAAVGNQDLDPNKDYYPAACDHVVGVAATTAGDASIGLDHGPYVDVSAPGHGIYSTWRGGGYDYNSGASLAAPLVSGLAALLYAHYPHYGDQEVAWAILGHAKDLGFPGKDDYYGWGRINAYRAVDQGATSMPDYALGREGNRELDSAGLNYFVTIAP